MTPAPKKILVTDDEALLTHIVRTNLVREGFEVQTARDGVECLSKLKSEKPDLLILDVVMPRKSGWQVLEEVRGNPETRNLPVILLTVLVEDEDAQRAARLGCDHYMPKPFEPADLISTVKRLLG